MSMNFLRGIGNHHIELSRLLWFISVIAAIGYAGAHLYINHAFDILQFGAGISAMLLGGGGATAVKDTAVSKASTQQGPAQ